MENVFNNTKPEVILLIIELVAGLVIMHMVFTQPRSNPRWKLIVNTAYAIVTTATIILSIMALLDGAALSGALGLVIVVGANIPSIVRPIRQKPRR